MGLYLLEFEKTPHKENAIPVTNKIAPIISTGNNPILKTVCQYFPNFVFHSVVFFIAILAIKEDVIPGKPLSKKKIQY